MINTTAQDQDAAAAAIVAEGLTKHFTVNGHLIKAVDGVSFALVPRQLIAVLGPRRSPRKPPTKLATGQLPQKNSRKVAFIRPCSRSGVRTWRIVTWLRSWMLAENPVTIMLAAITKTGRPSWASGTASSAPAVSTCVTQIVRPRPSRRTTADEAHRPARLLTPSAANMVPISAGEK